MRECKDEDLRSKAQEYLECSIFKRELAKDLERISESYERAKSPEQASIPDMNRSDDFPRRRARRPRREMVINAHSHSYSCKSAGSFPEDQSSGPGSRGNEGDVDNLYGSFLRSPEHGRWEIVRANGTFFSVPHRMDWRSQWSVFDRSRITPSRARARRFEAAKVRSMTR